MPMRECFICQRWGVTERHHIFGGANRGKSERYGLVVDLCPLCHRGGKSAAHRSAETAQHLHEYGQRKWMNEQNGGIDDFTAEFGRNYL